MEGPGDREHRQNVVCYNMYIQVERERALYLDITTLFQYHKQPCSAQTGVVCPSKTRKNFDLLPFVLVLARDSSVWKFYVNSHYHRYSCKQALLIVDRRARADRLSCKSTLWTLNVGGGVAVGCGQCLSSASWENTPI